MLSLRRDVLPKSVARYNLMAESYVDQINELRSEIEEYLGIADVADTTRKWSSAQKRQRRTSLPKAMPDLPPGLGTAHEEPAQNTSKGHEQARRGNFGNRLRSHRGPFR